MMEDPQVGDKLAKGSPLISLRLLDGRVVVVPSPPNANKIPVASSITV